MEQREKRCDNLKWVPASIVRAVESHGDTPCSQLVVSRVAEVPRALARQSA